MLIAISPDKFKGTLSAAEAAEAIAAGVREAIPDVRLRLLPAADGGEGTAEIFGRAKGWSRQSIDATDPLGRPLSANYYAGNEAAVIDSSEVIGLQRISPADRNPWLSSSYGFGNVVRRLLESGFDKVYAGIGGTATVDAGIGFIQGLGAKIYCADGLLERPFRACDLLSLIKIDYTPLSRFAGKIIGLSDVDVPLNDNDGYPSMLMFAPQKGVDEDSLIVLKMGLDRLYENVRWIPGYPHIEIPFGGSGGGLGFAIGAVCGGDVSFGAEEILRLNSLFLPRPDLIITGEGSYDNQSLRGKVTSCISAECQKSGIPCAILAGQVQHGLESELVIAVTPPGEDPDPAAAARYLRNAAADLIRTLGSKHTG